MDALVDRGAPSKIRASVHVRAPTWDSALLCYSGLFSPFLEPSVLRKRAHCLLPPHLGFSNLSSFLGQLDQLREVK